MNKKGFTLLEITVVVVLIGALLLLVMPSIGSIFSNSLKSTLEIQENEVEDAGSLYLEDYCKNKLGSNVCPSTISINSDYTYSGYVKLDTLVTNEYIEEVSLQKKKCRGCVIYKNNKPEAYLICGDVETETAVDFRHICDL